MRRSGERGVVLVLVLLILTVALTMVPLVVFWAQTEAKWTSKKQQADRAFNLAEAAVERGYLELTRFTANWEAIQSGQHLEGLELDRVYNDVAGGEYAIWISSGTEEDQAVIIGVGRSTAKGGVRALKVTYSKAGFGNIALQSGNGVSVSGNNFQVHWGAIVTPNAIAVNNRQFPQLWSASYIDSDSNGSQPPNCDGPNCCQWHSYSASVPPRPLIDLDFYRSSATAAGNSEDSDCGSYYHYGNKTLESCSDTSGKTFFVDGNLTVKSSGGGNYIIGNVVVIGNLILPSGNYGAGAVSVSVPEKAWQQYCRSWSVYRNTFDNVAPDFWPGPISTYIANPSLTYGIDKVLVRGFLYVGGDLLNQGGGGNGVIVGSVYVGGTVNLSSNSNAVIYYLPSASTDIKTLNVILQRSSWEEISYKFPEP